MTDRDVLTLAAAAIADWPKLWRPLLDGHVARADGRCAACPLPQSPTPVWPCNIAVLASTAALVNEVAAGGAGRPAGAPPAGPGRPADPRGTTGARRTGRSSAGTGGARLSHRPRRSPCPGRSR